MREVLALMKAGWLTTKSYRVATLLSIGGLLLSVVPVYFIAQALQPMMATRIAGEGRQYFGFLVLGLVAFSAIVTAINALPNAIAAGIGSGTLEALLSTRAPLARIVSGLVSFEFLWSAIRASLVLVAGWLLGAEIVWRQAVLGAGIMTLIVCAHAAIGLFLAAMVLAFRTTGPLAQAVLAVSGLLGGVYYPTHVIPSWIQRLSDAVPLTYGLRALRRALLEGVTAGAVANDMLALAGFAVVLGALSLASFWWALRHARRSGTLTQY